MLPTSLSKIMIRFIGVLLEVIKEPADGFLIIVALLTFNDNLLQMRNVNRRENDERAS